VAGVAVCGLHLKSCQSQFVFDHCCQMTLARLYGFQSTRTRSTLTLPSCTQVNSCPCHVVPKALTLTLTSGYKITWVHQPLSKGLVSIKERTMWKVDPLLPWEHRAFSISRPEVVNLALIFLKFCIVVFKCLCS